jgi:hypothetical protein
MNVEAMKQALDALEGWAGHGKWIYPESALEQAKKNTSEAIPVLRAAIQQAEETRWKLSCGCPSQYGGIPAEWATTDREGNPAIAYGVICEKHWHEYDAQHPKAWQGLTADEVKTIFKGTLYCGDTIARYEVDGVVGWKAFARAIETKLKEKNT